MFAVEEKEGEANTAMIKVDLAALLEHQEDPLITNSWIASLEEVSTLNAADIDGINKAVKTALGVVANKWVAAYLRKALKLSKGKNGRPTKRALVWLLDRVKEARPDLSNRSVRESRLAEIRAKIVEEAQQEMDKLDISAPAVKEEDLVSDVEESDDEDSDESDDEDMGSSEKETKKAEIEDKDESELPASAIPPRPSPTLVDLLLPPVKPNGFSEFLNAFTWPQMAGAACWRIIHRYKRLRNEIDDSLRAVHDLPPLNVSQRREREALLPSRVFTECCAKVNGESLCETAVEQLCSGVEYLDLSPVQRLCILRILIEAAYDTQTVQKVVDENFKSRINAQKTVDAEERKAKKDAKNKAIEAETAARERLGYEAREKFLEEKRQEIRKLNEGSNEFTEEFIESLTDEDILEFDEDTKMDFASLPAPESFGKLEVNEMVRKMQEAEAFETHSLRVLTMEELVAQEAEELKALEDQLASLGGENLDQFDASIDRETSRAIERLRKKIEKTKESQQNLPGMREVAILILRDAIDDGTIKVLKSAVREAKVAKLTGEDETTGGAWALDVMRDAALELEKAKQHKRVADARKELVAKLNKCFIRNEPLGQDRFRNRFWHFDRDEHTHFWVSADYVMKQGENGEGENKKVPAGFRDVTADGESIFMGAQDEEEDLIGNNEADKFRVFSRQEYHSSGMQPCLARRDWGCFAKEKTLRTLIKDLDSRGIREQELKSKMKEALEDNVGSGEKEEGVKDEAPVQQTEDKTSADENSNVLTSGDEEAFKKAKEAEAALNRDGIATETLDSLASSIGVKVRVRINDEKAKVARYETGEIVGWRYRTVSTGSSERDSNSDEDESQKPTVEEVSEWKAATDRGHVYWLSGSELMESICRFVRWESRDKGYFESDAAFLAYRNSIGKFLGRVAEAPYASSPMVFAKLMVKKEQELYSKLKNRNYDNNWGGKSGARAVWTNAMKDFTYDFKSCRGMCNTLSRHKLDIWFEHKVSNTFANLFTNNLD